MTKGLQMAKPAPLRILFWGMLGNFSRLALRQLLAAGFDVAGIIVAALRSADLSFRRVYAPPPVSTLPVLTPYANQNILHLGWERNIPTYEIGSLSAPETRQMLARTEPSVACVACFPRRLPPDVLSIPSAGFLNLHPSLLPAFRGPTPLFWTFRAGVLETGVTVHFMDEGLDTGDIALQAPVILPEGLTGPEAEQILAEEGGKLLAEACRQLAAGNLPRHPQPATAAHDPFPEAEDFHIPLTWSARRAFIFMRGTAEWGRPYVFDGELRVATARRAVDYTSAGKIAAPVVRDGNDLWIQFSPGVLHARRTPQ